MNSSQHIDHLIKEAENNPSNYDRIIEIGKQLNQYGDIPVEIILRRLVAMPSELHRLSVKQFALCEAYLWTLEGMNSSKSYETILDAKIYFVEDDGYWGELLDILEMYSSQWIVEISRAVLRADRIDIKRELAVLLASSGGTYETFSSELIENMVKIFKYDIEFALMFKNWIVFIINKFDDRRFVDIAIDLLRRKDFDSHYIDTEIFAKLQHDRLKEYIVPLLQDEDEFVRQKSREALAKSGFHEE